MYQNVLANEENSNTKHESLVCDASESTHAADRDFSEKKNLNENCYGNWSQPDVSERGKEKNRKSNDQEQIAKTPEWKKK